MSIINSLLDTDFYKFTMAQVVLHRYPAAMARYAFKCRNNIDLTGYVEEIKAEVQHLCSLRFKKEELDYLSSISYFKPDFIEYLRLLQLNPDYIKVCIKDNKLAISIEGPWISTIWFEVPVLAIVSEIHSKHQKQDVEYIGNDRLSTKIRFLNSRSELSEIFKFADFGTRRRHSHRRQDYVINEFLKKLVNPMFIGTSNVYFAMKYGIKPIGTMAHVYIQAHQQLGVRLEDSQKEALQVWADEYRGELGIALTDTVGMDAFLKDFDPYFAKLFDGCRHDSGGPYEWCSKLIDHYKGMGIDPSTKTAVFSDGLNFEIAVNICNTFRESIKTSFGIGTNLTNDMGFRPPSIVIKMVECNGRPVAKISDSPGKGMCEDDDYLVTLKRSYKTKE